MPSCFRNHVAEFFAVGLFSFLGVFIRIQLSTALTQYQDHTLGSYSSIFTTQPYLISNVLGCFLIAVLTSNKDALSSYSLACYTGLTSGLCGSLTTFSSWMVTNFDALFTKENVGYLILRVVVQFSLTWSALIFGFHVASLCSRVIKAKHEEHSVNLPRDDVEESVEDRSLNISVRDEEIPAAVNEDQLEGDHTFSAESYVWFFLFVCCSITLFVSLVVLRTSESSEANDRSNNGLNGLAVDRLKSLVLAPPGAWLRWSLSKTKIKETWPELHLHTLSVNLVAVLIASCLTEFDTITWQHNIVSGFCGSLSTVSTLFNELHKLNNDKGPLVAARYMLLTFLPAVAIVQIVMLIKQQTD